MIRSEVDGNPSQKPTIASSRLRRGLLLVQGLASYGLVVAAALLFNRGNSKASVLFLFACLGLPLLGSRPEDLMRTLIIRRDGWLIVAAFVLSGLIVAYGAFLAVVRGYLGAMFLHPALPASLRFLARQASLLIPLALAEEFFFRGYFQETLFSALWGRSGVGPLSFKNLTTALLFGLAHGLSTLSPVGFMEASGGLILGWLMERSGGSIWPVVVLHALSNLGVAWFTLLIGLNGPVL